MPAPKGHTKWGNPLKPKKYTPNTLWKKACEYFEWCDNNPVMVVEQTRMPQKLNANMISKLKPAQVKAFMKQTIELPHQRAYSIEGLCIHLNMAYQTFLNYESKKGYETYFEVCLRIRNIIDNQHFEGGMAGTFNANIVTRKLGLTEKQDVNIQTEQPLFPDVPEDNGN